MIIFENRKRVEKQVVGFLKRESLLFKQGWGVSKIQYLRYSKTLQFSVSVLYLRYISH